jgi:hypothetical protein
MSDDQRAELARRIPIVNPDGHPLSAYNCCLILSQFQGTPTIVGGFRRPLQFDHRSHYGRHEGQGRIDQLILDGSDLTPFPGRGVALAESREHRKGLRYIGRN